MSTKHFFVLLLVSVMTAGCNILDRPSVPNVTTPPPYRQSQSQQAQNQLADVRAFHERETAEIADEMYVFRNREMARLTAAGKELEQELGQGNIGQGNKRESEQHQTPLHASPKAVAVKTPEQPEKWSWSNWTSRFKKKSNENETAPVAAPLASAPLVSEADSRVQ